MAIKIACPTLRQMPKFSWQLHGKIVSIMEYRKWYMCYVQISFAFGSYKDYPYIFIIKQHNQIHQHIIMAWLSCDSSYCILLQSSSRTTPFRKGSSLANLQSKCPRLDFLNLNNIQTAQQPFVVSWNSLLPVFIHCVMWYLFLVSAELTIFLFHLQHSYTISWLCLYMCSCFCSYVVQQCVYVYSSYIFMSSVMLSSKQTINWFLFYYFK